MTYSNQVSQLAKAIAHAEGFGVAGAIPTIGNNPGDLTGADGRGFLTNGVMNSEGVLRFLTLADGWEALHVKVNRMLSGQSAVYPLTMTLDQVGMKYSGDPNWATNVAFYLGVSTTTTLAQLAA